MEPPFHVLPAASVICKHLARCSYTLAMYTFCRRVKIYWYIVLIAYHGCDVCLDWYNYDKLYKDKTVSGVLISTNTTIVKYENPFWISCLTGSVFSFLMAVVYVYYICFHCCCFCHANNRSVSSCDCESSSFGDRECVKRCNRYFFTIELWVSAFELLFKDDIQSIILYLLYALQSIVTRPSWYFTAFTMFTVFAHFKLCICFMSKLCGCGVGEESQCCNDDSSCVKKKAACVFGCIGSAVCFFLTVAPLN